MDNYMKYMFRFIEHDKAYKVQAPYTRFVLTFEFIDTSDASPSTTYNQFVFQSLRTSIQNI